MEIPYYGTLRGQASNEFVHFGSQRTSETVISILSKPADQISVADLKELIDSQVPEGDQIEFKEALSTKDGSPDRWATGADKIGDRARNELLEEAVAFANAYGGTLVLGIAETKARPRVAARICPVPRCVDLAERLKQVFGHCVEPQIPGLNISAIPTNGDGGAVIIRVGKSRTAPHRVKPTRECTIRRADRCEKMTMREIQDLTLNTSRGLERMERRLRGRSERFAEEFNCLKTPEQACGIRVTAVPVGEEIQFDRVYREYQLCHDLYEPWHSISIKSGQPATNLKCPTLANVWRPKLRSARNEYHQGASSVDLQMYREIHCDGLAEIGLTNCHVFHDGVRSGPRVYHGWPIVLFANLIAWADRIRGQALLPMAEYAVDVEFYIRGNGMFVVVYGNDSLFIHNDSDSSRSSSFRYPGELPSGPRYSLGEQSEITELIGVFERDFWNSIGQDVDQEERRFVIENWDGVS